MNKVFIIDNYDSFTWNLYQYFREMGAVVLVKRNDDVSIADIEQFSPKRLVISPGPGRPEDAGVILDVISYFCFKIPILGVCLGHQAIAQFFGARLKHARKVMHGKSSLICHDGRGVFTDLTVQSLNVIRYNSLVVDPNSVPACLEITAWSVFADGRRDEIMGIRHGVFPIEGIQFHPESILSEKGHHMLFNFMNY